MNEFFRKMAMMNRDMPKSTKNIYIGIFILFIAFIGFKLIKSPEILISVVAFYFAIVFHEVAHGAMAYAYGDPTAKIAGRLTLNPVKHVDIIGMAVPMVLMLIGIPAIGWAKPVPVNYRMIKKKTIGMFMVSIAGVATNFIMAIIAAIVLTVLIKSGSANIAVTIIKTFLVYTIQINVLLGIFNLIPIPPLDGSRIVYTFADSQVRNFLDSMENYGIIIILLLMSVGVLDKILYPMSEFVINNIQKIMNFTATLL